MNRSIAALVAALSVLTLAGCTDIKPLQADVDTLKSQIGKLQTDVNAAKASSDAAARAARAAQASASQAAQAASGAQSTASRALSAANAAQQSATALDEKVSACSRSVRTSRSPLPSKLRHQPREAGCVRPDGQLRSAGATMGTCGCSRPWRPAAPWRAYCG